MFNCRSLLPKLDELKLICHLHKPNFAFCTETWLNDKIGDNILSTPNFKLFRHDRNYKKGGGVCVFYKSYIQADLVDIKISLNHIEHICFIANHFIFLLLYIPPNL